MLVRNTIGPTPEPRKDDARKPEEGNLNGRIILALGLLAGSVILAVAVYEMALLAYEVAHDKIWRPNLAELEEQVTKKFGESLKAQFKELKGLDTTRLFKRLAICEAEEQEILRDLVDGFHLSDEQLQEVLMGAHIRIEDDGKLFDVWEQKLQGRPRFSSHPSDGNQYGFTGPLVKELLFSQVTEKDKKYTWFQLENHPVSMGHIIRHMIDFFKYKIFEKQQGPFGSSKATHHSPIIIRANKQTISV